jgi:hypothetical protein
LAFGVTVSGLFNGIVLDQTKGVLIVTIVIILPQEKVGTLQKKLSHNHYDLTGANHNNK